MVGVLLANVQGYIPKAKRVIFSCMISELPDHLTGGYFFNFQGDFLKWILILS